MSSRSAHMPKAPNSRTDLRRFGAGCSMTRTWTKVPSARFTSSSGLKTPSSYLAAIVIASALVSQEYQGGRLRRDLMAKLVAMAIDIRPVFVDAFRHPNPQVFE